MMTLASQAKLLWRQVTTRRSFNAHLAITMSTNIVMALIGLTTGVLAARILGPEGRGQLAAIQTWPLFFATIAVWGLSEAVVYFTAKQPRYAGQYMTSATTLALLLALPVAGFAWVLMPWLMAAQDPQIVTYARIYLLFIIAHILLIMQSEAIRGSGNLLVWNLLRPMPSLAWLCALVAALLLGIQSPQWVAFVFLGLLFLIIFPRFIVIKRQIQPPFWPPVLKIWKPMLGYGTPLVLSSVPIILNLRLDQMVMVALLPATVVGYYVTAVAWSAAISPLINAIGMVLFPHTASASNLKQQTHILKQGFHLTTITTVGLSFPILLLTPLAIPILFGADFKPAISAALILVLAGVVLNLKSVFQEGLRGLGQPRTILWGEGLGLVVTVIVLPVMLMSLGILGAALASLLSYSVTAAFYLWKMAYLVDNRMQDLLLPQKEDWYLIKSHLLKVVPAEFLK